VPKVLAQRLRCWVAWRVRWVRLRHGLARQGWVGALELARRLAQALEWVQAKARASGLVQERVQERVQEPVLVLVLVLVLGLAKVPVSALAKVQGQALVVPTALAQALAQELVRALEPEQQQERVEMGSQAAREWAWALAGELVVLLRAVALEPVRV
jgi:NOL1/NOP2/fmu family ribosome biogenesis protein